MQLGMSERFAGIDMVEVVRENMATAIFAMLSELPLQVITAALTTIVIAIFFVTSSDSGSLVIDTITSGDHPERKAWQRVFWSLIVGAIAAVLLLAGGLVALQTAAITTALPLSLIMIVICVGLVKGLSAETVSGDPISSLMESLRTRITPFQREHLGEMPPEASARVAAQSEEDIDNWQDRLKKLMENVKRHRLVEPSEKQATETITNFINNTVLPAYDEIAEQLRLYGREVKIESDDHQATLFVMRGEKEEFAFGIVGQIYYRMDTAFPSIPTPQTATEDDQIALAEVVLRSGREHEAEIREWTKKGIIEDFLNSYSRWMGW